jgi:hypothetical protein
MIPQRSQTLLKLWTYKIKMLKSFDNQTKFESWTNFTDLTFKLGINILKPKLRM